jgi:hypothetical protein
VLRHRPRTGRALYSTSPTPYPVSLVAFNADDDDAVEQVAETFLGLPIRLVVSPRNLSTLCVKRCSESDAITVLTDEVISKVMKLVGLATERSP